MKKISHIFIKNYLFLALCFCLSAFFCHAQNFSSSNLKGTSVVGLGNIASPTSLQFGPDGRLYVAQQDGLIWAYKIQKSSASNYTVDPSGTERITLVREIPNHFDDGTSKPYNKANNKRQVTGLYVAGTASAPVVYVASSDNAIGAGTNGDVNLCTNSGILSKLYKEGNTWKKTDLVRGLPRSEENHAPNGMDLYGNTLLLTIGGFTNAGGPSRDWTFITEYALSSAILAIDLTSIEAMPVKTDPTGAHPYKYDLPTLNDPTRPDNPDGTDVNDPWGGNDGMNQAKLIKNGPIQIFSGGWRNAYDVVISRHTNREGKIYTIDNGPNRNWGGWPAKEPNGQVTNKYPEGEPGSLTVTNYDGFEYIGNIKTYTYGSYYGGHPTPIRANPLGAGLYSDNGTHKGWRNDNSNPNLPLPSDWPPVDPSLADLREGDYHDPTSAGDKSLIYFPTSTNGFCEYTYSGNPLYGDMLAAGYDGNIYRIKLNDQGEVLNNKDAKRLNKDAPFASGFGSKPLDIIAQGNNQIFEGTVWVATWGSNAITVFEPSSSVSCTGNTTSTTLDDDDDKFSNAEEAASGTDPCNAADKPKDHDGDGISNLWDDDDDNDNIKDKNDFFAIDPMNGKNTFLPTHYNLFNFDPGTGFFGLGFTGLMCNGVDDYLKQFDEDKMIAGGAVGALTLEEVPEGDAHQTLNNQMYAFQFGINVNKNTGIFTVHSGIAPSYFNNDPTNNQSLGIYMGTGDQDNYLKIALASNGGIGSIQLTHENNGIAAMTEENLPENKIPSAPISFYFVVDPDLGMVYPKYKIGDNIYSLTSPVILSGKLLSTVQTSDAALALGVISTSRGSGKVFNATWDYIEAYSGNLTGITKWSDGTVGENINLFPNPANETLNINFNSEKNRKYTIKIYNNLGQLMDTKIVDYSPAKKDYMMNIANLAKGIYYIQFISDKEERSATAKFLKQ